MVGLEGGEGKLMALDQRDVLVVQLAECAGVGVLAEEQRGGRSQVRLFMAGLDLFESSFVYAAKPNLTL